MAMIRQASKMILEKRYWDQGQFIGQTPRRREMVMNEMELQKVQIRRLTYNKSRKHYLRWESKVLKEEFTECGCWAIGWSRSNCGNLREYSREFGRSWSKWGQLREYSREFGWSCSNCGQLSICSCESERGWKFRQSRYCRRVYARNLWKE